MSDVVEVGLLDTSTVILLGRIVGPTSLPDEAVISAITPAELSVGPPVAATESERIARQVHLQQAENDFDVIAFDGPAARIRRGRGRAANRRAREGGPRLGCAHRRDCHREWPDVVHVNPSDFDGVPGLDLHVAPHPDVE
jgi:predicted nucleic acid-binding protein